MTIKPKTIDLIRQELEAIPEEHRKPFASNYEGYAVLKAQLDDMWYVIRKGEKRIKKQLRFEEGLKETVQYYHMAAVRDEATKIAAMAVRIIQELTASKDDDEVTINEKAAQ